MLLLSMLEVGSAQSKTHGQEGKKIGWDDNGDGNFTTECIHIYPCNALQETTYFNNKTNVICCILRLGHVRISDN